MTEVTIAKRLCSYKGMTLRNIKVYLKDKTAIVFSMMTQIIILGLYLLFLKQNYVDSITSVLNEFGGFISDEQIQSLVNSWLVSGVIGTSLVTVALNSLTVMVSDKQNKIDLDYTASSVKGSTVVMSYFSGAVVNTIIMSAVLLTAGLCFLAVTGACTLGAAQVAALYALIILGSVSATIILMFFASFFKKTSGFGGFNTLVSVAIGFVIGAYIPVSQFSESVQTIVNIVPGSHIAAMIRQILVSPCISDISSAIGGSSLYGTYAGSFEEQAKEMFAVNLNMFGNEVDFSFMLLYSFGAVLLFLLLSLITFNLTSKRKN